MIKDKYDYAIENELVKADKDGTIYKRCENGGFKKIKQNNQPDTYKLISVIIKGKRVSLSAHRIVAKIFLPNPKNKPIVNHLDSNKSNNKLENLEWCTAKENVHHALTVNSIHGKSGCIHCGAKTRANYTVCAKCRYEIAKSSRINRI